MAIPGAQNSKIKIFNRLFVLFLLHASSFTTLDNFSFCCREIFNVTKGNKRKYGRGEEVISVLQNIPNKDEVVAILMRNLSKLTKQGENGIKVYEQGGQIIINGVTINMNKVCNIKINKRTIVKRYLSIKINVTNADLLAMRNIFISNGIKLPNINKVVKYAEKLMSCYDRSVKENIVSTFAKLLSNITDPIHQALSEMFRNNVPFKLLQTILNYFSSGAEELESQYLLWTSTKSEKYYSPLFDYVVKQQTKRNIQFMEEAVNVCYESGIMKEESFSNLITYFYEWFVMKYNNYQQELDRRSRRTIHSANRRFTTVRTYCDVCKGYYFQNQK